MIDIESMKQYDIIMSIFFGILLAIFFDFLFEKPIVSFIDQNSKI